MSLQGSSPEKPFQPFVTSLFEAYPDASMHSVAVLFTDVVGSTKYFKAHGDIKGREMLRKHHKIAIAIVEDYGGSLIKEVGDSVMVYFPDAFNALKASIKMQHKFNIYNKNNESQNEIHIRIGIHFGKVIVEEKDIYGDVVNVASKLTNLANGDQIFISQEVYELAKDTSLANFELINFWNMKNVPTGLTIYKVIWENSTVSEPERLAILHLRFKGNHEPDNVQRQFQEIWDNFVRDKESFLANEQESTYTSPDGTLAISFKDSSIALNVAERLLEHLSEKLLKKGSTEKPPVHMVIIKDTHPKGNLVPMKKTKIDLDGFNPGEICLSKNIFDDIKKQKNIQVTPLANDHSGRTFYKYIKGNQEQITSQSTSQQTPIGNNYTKDILAPCFYCGGKTHYAKDCPSKTLTESTRAIHEAGYLSVSKIKKLFSLYKGAAPRSLIVEHRNNGYSENELAANCFFELKSIYQLRFFRTIWESNFDLWEKAKQNISVSEGGFAWLALDSFRVSNYGRAETFLNNALETNLKDYKPYCIRGFLNIEKNNLFDALKDFDNALLLSRTNPQKMFIQLLQSRIHSLLGNIPKAQEKVHKVLLLDSTCREAIYEDIILKLKQKKEKPTIQRLIKKLIEENKKYYVVALIDPDMEPYSDIVDETLIRVLDEARNDALHCAQEARTKVQSVQIALTKKNNEDIQLFMSKIENMLNSESYFGYLDVAQLGSNIISICNNALKLQKKDLLEVMSILNRRLEGCLEFVRHYRYPQFSNTCFKRLKLLKSEISGIGDLNEFFSASEFEVGHNLCNNVARELDVLDPIIKKLEIYQQSIIVSLNFLKHSSILFSIVFFVGIFLFPFIIDPMNIILSKIGISSIPDTWSFQKTLLILGSIMSLVASFLITAKKSFN